MADAKKAKTSTFANRKSSWERLEQVEEDLLQYIREGISIRRSCYILDIPLSTFYNWLKIAENNPNAPDDLKKFRDNFQEAKVEGREVQLKMEKLGNLKLTLDTEAIVYIKNITGFSGIIEAKLTKNFEQFAKEQKLADSSNEQDDKEEHSHNPDFDDFQKQLKE